MAARAGEYRVAGKRLVFTNGCFDLLHAGHVTLLEEAARRCACRGGQRRRRSPATQRPDAPRGRGAGTRRCGRVACVDHVLLFDDDTPLALLEAIRPDVLIKGGDYPVERVVGRDFVASYGGEVCVATLVSGVSTSAILQRLAEGRAADPATAVQSTPQGVTSCE